MTLLTALPVLIPLIAGFTLIFVSTKGFILKRTLNIAVVIALILLSIKLISTSLSGEQQVYLVGNWVAPFGIVFVLDQLSALMVLITSILALGALWYAAATKIDENGSYFHVLFQLQLFGLNGAFMTGDLFNLFVFFEVLLLASYGLLLHGSGAARTKAGLHYVVINLIGSTLFLFAVGALYGALGTLNMADLAAKISSAPSDNLGLIAAAGLLLLVVFGIKAAMFPLYLWLPNAYSQTSAPVAALFAIMTKVGIYAIIRVHGTLFGNEAGELANYYIPWVLGLGLITLAFAAFGVSAAKGLRQQIAYLVLSSVSILLIGVGINSPEALAATIYYLIHSTLIGGGLFLLADIITRGRGEFQDQFVTAPSMSGAIIVGSFFIFGAVAITGMPPLSGFMGKMLILSASLDHAWFATILTVVLLAGLLMIVSLARSGSLLFYNIKEKGELPGEELNHSALIAMIGLFMAGPILVVFANSITAYTEVVAQQLYNNPAYIEAVLNTPAKTE